MKQYIAKYLPVEGEIKKDSKLINPTLPLLGVMEAITDNEGAKIKAIGGSKVKLFLCSRDIQVGDTVKALLADKSGYKDYLITEKDSAQLSIKTGDFKVIGEISSEAKWVKEGDEFDEEELQPYLYCNKHPDESIYGFNMDNIEQWIKLNPNPIKFTKMVEIKGKCGHFH